MRFIKLTLKILLFCNISFATENCLPGLCRVSDYESCPSQPLNKPYLTQVSKAKKATCIVKVFDENGNPSQMTGVLIAPDLVVTAMHGIDGSKGVFCNNSNNIKVLFDYETEPLPEITDPRWIQAKDMDPTPTRRPNDGTYINSRNDFVVLKLSVAQTIDYVKINTDANGIPSRPFLLHHPHGSPMLISYDYLTTNSVQFKATDNFTVDDKTYYGTDGSSGGGFFWGENFNFDKRDGELIGLFSGYWPPDGSASYLTKGPRAWNILDNKIGAKRLIPTIQLGSYISTSDLNTIWSSYPGVPASETSTYKYKSIHTATPDYIWYKDGTLTNGGTFVLPLDNIVAAPAGKYYVFFKMKRSTTYFNGLSGSGQNTMFYLDGDNTYNLSSNSLKIGDVSDFDFFTKTNCGSINCNDNHAYSDLIEFKLGPIDLSNIRLQNTKYLKFKTALNCGANNISGLSIHSVRFEYVDEDNDGVPWYNDNCPKCPNPIPSGTWSDIYGKVHTNEQIDKDLDGIGDECDECPTDPANKCNMTAEANSCRNITQIFYTHWNKVPEGDVFMIDWGDVPNWRDNRDLSKAITSIPSDGIFSASHQYTSNKNYHVTVYDLSNNGIIPCGIVEVVDCDINVNCSNPDVMPKLDFWPSYYSTDQMILTSPISTNLDLGLDCVVKNTGGRIISWQVDYGDGSAPSVTYTDKVGYPLQSQRIILQHTYSSCNTYTLKVKAIGTKPELVCEKNITINAFTKTTPPDISFGYYYNYNNNNIGPQGGTIMFMAWDKLDLGSIEPATIEWTFGNGAKAFGETAFQYFSKDQSICPITVSRTSCGGKSIKTITRDQLHPCPWFEAKMINSTATNVTYDFYPTYNIGGEIKDLYYSIGNHEILSPVLHPPSDFHHSSTFERKVTPYKIDVYTHAINEIGIAGIIITEIINPISPSIDFAVSSTTTLNSRPIQFNANNTGGQVLTWYWDFGDGTSSSIQNPSHRYTKPGIYTVMLKGTGPEFSDIETKSNYITVKPDISPILQLLLD